MPAVGSTGIPGRASAPSSVTGNPLRFWLSGRRRPSFARQSTSTLIQRQRARSWGCAGKRMIGH
eukprot:9961742-Alexandrium_andersonii.AAC.1